MDGPLFYGFGFRKWNFHLLRRFYASCFIFIRIHLPLFPERRRLAAAHQRVLCLIAESVTAAAMFLGESFDTCAVVQFVPLFYLTENIHYRSCYVF